MTPAAPEPETRDKILAAAHTVFLRHGSANARTQDIADEAGVNKALLHYYFGTKADLARAVLAKAHAELFPGIFGILADPTRDIDTKVRGIVEYEIDFLSRQPYLPGFVASELHTNPELLAEIMARMGPPPLGVLQQQINEEAAAGRMRPYPAPQFVISLIAALVFPFVMRPMLERLFLHQEGGFTAFLAERRRTLADFFLAGLRP
jgi:AcrR family transcriptional regulator